MQITLAHLWRARCRLGDANLARSNKRQNLGRDYAAVARRLHDLGITTATFHIQTPYPGTRLYARTEAAGRILTRDWDLYDTRHVVYRPARLTPERSKKGYDWAYREFYRWSSIARGSLSHGAIKHQAKHFFYAAGWKKFEPLWDLVIRARQLRVMTPVLESVLSKVTVEESGSSRVQRTSLLRPHSLARYTGSRADSQPGTSLSA